MKIYLLSLLLLCLPFHSIDIEKINGLSIVGGPNPLSEDTFTPILNTHANSITLMPFAYGKFGSSNLAHKNLSWQWWGEGFEGTEESLILAKEAGLQVMIKPQIWFDHGKFTGHFKLNSPIDWEKFEQSYADFIIQYARLSEKHNLHLFCIGTELSSFILERESFWKRLIENVRKVYSGKLVYAANWDTYKKIPLWDKLDYIGVDAYFPICNDQTPSIKSLMKGWHPYAEGLKDFGNDSRKQILFTEWGYRSADYCGKEPWDYNEKLDYNPNAQYNAYQAVFKMFWDKDWFAGGYVWKWFPSYNEAGGHGNNRYTPQNKPAETVLFEWFNKE